MLQTGSISNIRSGLLGATPLAPSGPPSLRDDVVSHLRCSARTLDGLLTHTPLAGARVTRGCAPRPAGRRRLRADVQRTATQCFCQPLGHLYVNHYSFVTDRNNIEHPVRITRGYAPRPAGRRAYAPTYNALLRSAFVSRSAISTKQMNIQADGRISRTVSAVRA